MNKKALLIGYGSVGKKHLQNLETNGYSVDICEIDLSTLANLKKKKYFVEKKVSKFKENVYDIAVIASWGPDHHKHFREVVEILKVKKLF